MKNQDYILLIMNCKKYKYKAEAQKQGWLQNVPKNIIYYHVIGDESITNNYMFDDNNKILYVKTPDDYNSLPHKVIKSFFAIHNEFQYKYIFKTDDDQNLIDILFFDNLTKSIETISPDYGGNLITISKDEISEYYIYHPELPRDILVKATKYCNGRFYILSKRAVLHLIEKMDKIKKEYFEDYATGYYLTDSLKANFLPINNNVFIDFL
jgi:hypothetical protein